MHSFYTRRSQMCKKDQAVSLFVLLESECIKASRKMLMKLIPGGSGLNLERYWCSKFDLAAAVRLNRVASFATVGLEDNPEAVGNIVGGNLVNTA